MGFASFFLMTKVYRKIVKKAVKKRVKKPSRF